MGADPTEGHSDATDETLVLAAGEALPVIHERGSGMDEVHIALLARISAQLVRGKVQAYS